MLDDAVVGDVCLPLGVCGFRVFGCLALRLAQFGLLFWVVWSFGLLRSCWGVCFSVVSLFGPSGLHSCGCDSL